MTPQDYEYLRKLLKARSGLVLSAGEALPRRKPAAAGRAQERAVQSHRPRRQASRPGCRAAHRRGGRGHDDERVVLLPRQAAVRAFPRHHHAGAAVGARREPAHPHLVRGRRHRPGAVFARHRAEGDGQGPARLADRDRRDRSLHRGPGESQERHLQPVRGAARPAGADADQIFLAGRRDLADRSRDPRHGASSCRSTCSTTSPISAASIWCCAATC